MSNNEISSIKCKTLSRAVVNESSSNNDRSEFEWERERTVKNWIISHKHSHNIIIAAFTLLARFLHLLQFPPNVSLVKQNKINSLHLTRVSLRFTHETFAATCFILENTCRHERDDYSIEAWQQKSS
jgi:hypothetical protein